MSSPIPTPPEIRIAAELYVDVAQEALPLLITHDIALNIYDEGRVASSVKLEHSVREIV